MTKIDPKKTQNRNDFQSENQEGLTGIGPQTLGASPPWRRPRSLGEGGQATRDRPPGTHARGKRSKEVYHYTIIQSIQYTLYSIQCTWVQYTVCQGWSIQYIGYKGIRVYSIQGTKGSGERVYNVEDLARWAQALRIGNPCTKLANMSFSSVSHKDFHQNAWIENFHPGF